MLNPHSAAVDLASLLDGSSAGELIPQIVRDGLQRLIQLELAAFLGADWHERTEERLGHRNGYSQDCCKQHPPLRAANPQTQTAIGKRLEKADQIRCSGRPSKQ